MLFYSPFFRSFISSKVYANVEARCWLPKARWCTTVAIPKAQCSALASSCSCDIHAPSCTLAHDVDKGVLAHTQSYNDSRELGQQRTEQMGSLLLQRKPVVVVAWFKLPAFSRFLCVISRSFPPISSFSSSSSPVLCYFSLFYREKTRVTSMGRSRGSLPSFLPSSSQRHLPL